MITSKQNKFVLAQAFVLAMFSHQVLASDNGVIDNFESYADGRVIGSSAESSPWRRFGYATTDNIVATHRRNKVISGRISGQYGAYWPNRFGAIRYVFKKPMDLSNRPLIGIKMRSDEPSTQTMARLAITNDKTTYVVAESQPLTDQVKSYVFKIDEADVISTVGDEEFSEVIKNVTQIGFNFISIEGEYVETIIFDDFEFVSQTEDSTESSNVAEQPKPVQPKEPVIPVQPVSDPQVESEG